MGRNEKDTGAMTMTNGPCARHLGTHGVPWPCWSAAGQEQSTAERLEHGAHPGMREPRCMPYARHRAQRRQASVGRGCAGFVDVYYRHGRQQHRPAFNCETSAALTAPTAIGSMVVARDSLHASCTASCATDAIIRGTNHVDENVGGPWSSWPRPGRASHRQAC
jgi:hypothetical protein